MYRLKETGYIIILLSQFDKCKTTEFPLVSIYFLKNIQIGNSGFRSKLFLTNTIDLPQMNQI